MNFRKATDALLESVTLEDLAKEMGVSIQALRQARAAEGSSSHRSPPPGWQNATASLALKAAARYRDIARKLSLPKAKAV